MPKNQWKAISLVALMALLALPAYVLIGILTIPWGIGLLMLSNSSPWILNLYPLLYAGTAHGKVPLYYMDNALSIPLTILQWALIAWASSFVLRDFRPDKALFAALALLVAICTVTSLILSIAGIHMIWTAAHT